MNTQSFGSRPLHTGLRGVMLLVLLLFTVAAWSSNITWKIVISPSKSGSVYWKTSSPADEDMLYGSGSISFSSGSFVDLTFYPASGYKLVNVFKNLDSWPDCFDADKHCQFGPVGSPHVILAQFELIIPTGTHNFQTPTALPDGVAEMFSGTGHYTGSVPVGLPIVGGRTYDADVAMDESGKLDILPNSLQGYTPAPQITPTPITGKVKTVDNKPQVSVSTKFKGELDGVAGEGSGTGTLSGIVAGGNTGTNAPLGLLVTPTLNTDAIGKYKVNLKDTDTGEKMPLSGQDVAINTSVNTNASRNWSVALTISQSKDSKGKALTYAKALLTLPSGDQIDFADKKVQYSLSKGFNITFSKGTNKTTSLIDSKTKLAFNKMLFDCAPPNNCTLTGGQIKYSFLGQKGQGDLMNFVP